MNDSDTPQGCFPEYLSDEAAAAFLAFLYDLANAFENHYAGQLHRYYHGGDERQTDFREREQSEPPF